MTVHKVENRAVSTPGYTRSHFACRLANAAVVYARVVMSGKNIGLAQKAL